MIVRISDVKKLLKSQGKLDNRELFSYATLTGIVHGESFQNLVAAVFESDILSLYRAQTDGSVGDLLVSVPYSEMKDFQLKNRFLYSYTSLSSPAGSFRFYSYDKKIFQQGFRDAGMIT